MEIRGNIKKKYALGILDFMLGSLQFFLAACEVHGYIVVQFYSWFKFYFPLFLRYGNDI